MYNKDDIVYILENDQVVRKAKVAEDRMIFISFS